MGNYKYGENILLNNSSEIDSVTLRIVVKYQIKEKESCF